MRLIDADAFERAVMFSNDKDIQDVIYRLRDFPTIEPEPHWIPVSERLPEEDNCTGYGRQYSMDVLMTAHNSVDDEDIVDYGHTTDGRWFSCTADEYVPDNWSVLAWMPLPDPWKGEQDEA